MNKSNKKRFREHESRAAIERLYINMRHLFIRGSYKPFGVSGESIMQSLLTLRPEIYGDIADPEHVEINGLLYVIDRLPQGIEACRFIKLISTEGYNKSDFKVIIPSKRRRNCYRIDEEQMYIELTRGRSDIYDILTHLTFLYIEANKIKNHSLDHRSKPLRAWEKLEEIVQKESKGEPIDQSIAFTYLSTILGRTYDETERAFDKFAADSNRNSLYHVIYWLGKLAIDEANEGKDREISFSSTLRERVGHHVHGERWADTLKHFIEKKGLVDRPLHIVSANLHSVMNAIYAQQALSKELPKAKDREFDVLMERLSQPENGHLRDKVKRHALKNGMYEIEDTSGTNLTVQIIDTDKLELSKLPEDILPKDSTVTESRPVVLVMDYAFGEQAFETMDELFKPYESKDKQQSLSVSSVSIMGKAGILKGKKGDIMIATAHIFEGTTDNYPFNNEFTKEDFEGQGLEVFEGPMVTVLGTSLQNKDILKYFSESSWNAIGLEMEGVHYQKAIQAGSKIRKSIAEDIVLRYAYYASDNPLVTGNTLASGSLGVDGVKPTYLITTKILNKILTEDR